VNHGRGVRKEIGSVLCQVMRNQVGISAVFGGAYKFRWHDVFRSKDMTFFDVSKILAKGFLLFFA